MFEAILKQSPENALEFSLHFTDIDLEKEPKLRIRLVDAGKFFMPLYGKFIDLPLKASVRDASCVSFSLPQLLSAMEATNRNSKVMEFQLLYNGACDFVTCADFKEILVENKLLNYRFCLGSGGNLVLRLNWKELQILCDIVAERNEFVVNLNTKQPGSLALSHRIEHDIVWYDADFLYESEQPCSYRISYRELQEKMSADSEMFSLFYMVRAEGSDPNYYYRVITEQDPAKQRKGEYQFSGCKLKNGTASFDCRRLRQQAKLCGMDPGSDGVTLRFSEVEPTHIKLRRILSFPASRDSGERKFPLDNAWVYPDCHVTADHWENVHQREDLVFQLVAMVDGEEYWVIADETMEQTWALKHQNATLTAGRKGTFLRISERANRIRLGIFGTCMTRWAFSRKYTDAYRSLYEVTFAHFWPSVFSLAEEPIQFPEEKYAEYAPNEIPFIRREYEKTSFKELAQADCEYVLVDFFVDAIHGPRRMKDGKFIGYKAYAKDFYQDYLMFETEKYYMDTMGYFEAWKKNADWMIEELKKLFPENRIVLATGGLTHYYIDEDDCIKCFDGKTLRGSAMTKHSINALNYLWDRMNAYFITQMPNAQVLNMRQYNFMAYDQNPANVRPYHFRNEYYRTMSAELSRIVLWDRQNH